MKLSFRRHPLVALGLALSFVVAAAAPAYASYLADTTVPTAQRGRVGASTWTPRKVDFNSGWDTVNGNAWMVFGFDYYQTQHLADLRGSRQFLEIHAEVDCNWARNLMASQYGWGGSQGYRFQGFDTNVPSAALPYEDTDYLEPCAQELTHTGRGNFGVGVLNAAALVPGTHYYIRIALDRDPNVGIPGFQSAVTLRTGTGITFDSNDGWNPYLSGANCSFSDGQIAIWKNTTYNELQTRLRSSWCAWKDFSHTVVKYESAQLNTGQYKEFFPDKLYNQGMGDGGVGNSGYNFAGGRNAVNYCNDSWSGYDGVCFTEINDPTGSNWAPVWQDVSMAANNIAQKASYTAEAAFRCRTGAFCPMYLNIKGIGGPDPDEWRQVTVSVPNDSQWHVCREDANHGFENAFVYNHTTMRFELGITSSYQTVDIDYTFLGGKTIQDDPSKDGHPNDLPDFPTPLICS